MKKTPKTLLEAMRYFADPDVSLEFVVSLRWPNGVVCPACESKAVTFMKSRRMWTCKGCRKQFSVKVGTIFEDSPIKLDKWLAAIWLIANCKNGVSSWELHRGIQVTQKTAWFMLHRIRLAMQSGTFEKLSGHVEVDETFVGGLNRFRHADKKHNVGGGPGSKAIVMGFLERGSGKVHARMVFDTTAKTLREHVTNTVEPKSTLYTDSYQAYRRLTDTYQHEFVSHLTEWVRGEVHTNGLENFWSLLKRGLKGTYVSVEPYHLTRYVDEQIFRYNQRKSNDSERFTLAVSQIVGKRLTYAELTGKVGAA